MISRGAFLTSWKFLHTHVIKTARKSIITREEGKEFLRGGP